MTTPKDPKNQRQLTLREVAKAASKEYGLSVESLKGQCRLRTVSEARQIYCYLCRKYTSYSLADIAKSINRRSTCVTYSVSCVEFRMERYKDIAMHLGNIKSVLHITDEAV